MQEEERFWLARSMALVRQVNGGWWIQRWLQIGMPMCLVVACALLLARSRGWEPSSVGREEALIPVVTVLLLLLMISFLAWLTARKKFISRDEGMVRLEVKLGLRGALSSAQAGVGKWPAVRAVGEVEAARFRWRLARVALPGLIAVLVLGASLAVPLGSTPVVAASAEEPAAWSQMEDWLETLEEEKIVDSESAADVQQQIDELRERPEKDWFSHRSLEAGDSLKESLAQTITAMGQDLEMAEQALASLEAAGGGAAIESLREGLAQQYQEAAESLKASSLKLDPNLLQQLAEIDPSQLQQLDLKALKELRERLRKSSGT